MTTIARKLVLTGRVQGVAFRAHTVRAAERIGVVGFVANAADGSVRGEAQGTPAAVKPVDLADWLKPFLPPGQGKAKSRLRVRGAQGQVVLAHVTVER